MAVRGIPAPAAYIPDHYWEDRARRFAAQGDGLAAVCSYGMPGFYNRAIALTQRLALAPWLRPSPGAKVLDIGCGIGRWSRLLAARGAEVTGVDLSRTMIEEARRRAAADGVLERCNFLIQDTAALDAGRSFDLVLGVTVLQHILDASALRSAIQRIAAHTNPGGRIVLLEAAPARRTVHCNSTVFQARERACYLSLFAQCGLKLRALSGVDPAPFRTWLLPRLRALPAPLRLVALGAATAASVPVDVLFGRIAVERSWHVVFVLEHEEGSQHAR